MPYMSPVLKIKQYTHRKHVLNSENHSSDVNNQSLEQIYIDKL